MVKELDKTFTRNGFAYLQQTRKDNKAVYVQVNLNTGIMYYEVILIQRYKVNPDNPFHKSFAEQGYTEVERYPNDNQWGEYGWTFAEKWRAENKFNSLVTRKSSDKNSNIHKFLAKLNI